MTDANWKPLREILTQRADELGQIGHHALLERFVERNGSAYVPRKRIGRKRAAKQCFANAAHFVVANPAATYVEGFIVRKSVPWWPIHHAWVTISGEDAMDPTLNAIECEYFGVPFHIDALRRELVHNGVYGLLDPGLGLNAALMFDLDPDLRAIVDAVHTKAVARRTGRR